MVSGNQKEVTLSRTVNQHASLHAKIEEPVLATISVNVARISRANNVNMVCKTRFISIHYKL